MTKEAMAVDPMMQQMMQQMMMGVLQGVVSELTKTKPASESLREQSNVLAVYLVNIPSIKEVLKGAVEAKTLAKVMYNLSQEDFDMLYEAFEAAKKYRGKEQKLSQEDFDKLYEAYVLSQKI